MSRETVPYFILCPEFKLRNRAREKGKEEGERKRGEEEKGECGEGQHVGV
jgi:hypothetical protein